METVIQTTEPHLDVPPLERPLPKPTPWQIFRDRYGAVVVTVINLGLFFAIWQFFQGGAEPAIDTRWVPSPLSILESLINTTIHGKMIEHTIFSWTNYLLGFVVTIALGIPVGVFLGLNKEVRSVAQTFVWIGYSTPTVAILPILTVLMGFGTDAKVTLVALATFFPVAINVLNGIATIDPVLLKAGRVFGANRWQLFQKITLPALLPWILTGLRIASRRGLTAVIVAELYGSIKGLGFMVRMETDRFRSDNAYAAIIMLMLLSLIFLNGLAWLDERTAQWRAAAKI